MCKKEGQEDIEMYKGKVGVRIRATYQKTMDLQRIVCRDQRMATNSLLAHTAENESSAGKNYPQVTHGTLWKMALCLPQTRLEAESTGKLVFAFIVFVSYFTVGGGTYGFAVFPLVNLNWGYSCWKIAFRWGIKLYHIFWNCSQVVKLEPVISFSKCFLRCSLIICVRIVSLYILIYSAFDFILYIWKSSSVWGHVDESKNS